MTANEFQNVVEGKLFVELKNPDSILAFTSNPGGNNPYRDIADNKGVIVFLSTINKIYAKGNYYGGNYDSLLSMLNQKVDQSNFDNLTSLIGATSINDEKWGHNESISNVVNELSSNYASLADTISGIPRFQIQVTTIDENTKYPNVPSPDKSTIYLALSPEDEREGDSEMYTEWIYINVNAGKYEENNPLQPLPEVYKWEKIGRQAFKMTNYMDAEQINQVISDLTDYIDNSIEGISAAIDAANNYINWVIISE